MSDPLALATLLGQHVTDFVWSIDVEVSVHVMITDLCLLPFSFVWVCVLC